MQPLICLIPLYYYTLIFGNLRDIFSPKLFFIFCILRFIGIIINTCFLFRLAHTVPFVWNTRYFIIVTCEKFFATTTICMYRRCHYLRTVIFNIGRYIIWFIKWYCLSVQLSLFDVTQRLYTFCIYLCSIAHCMYALVA